MALGSHTEHPNLQAFQRGVDVAGLTAPTALFAQHQPGLERAAQLYERAMVLRSDDYQAPLLVALHGPDGSMEGAVKQWAEAEIGKIYRGKVVTIKEFGAFVEFLPGKDGLVHISELANFRVKQTEAVLKAPPLKL